MEDILLEVAIWVARGHREVVLTGVNLGEYRSEEGDLSDLIEALEAIDGLSRIRISSIEPTTVSPRLLKQMARSEKLCPYLHLPLQSGSDKILAAMGRRYTRKEYMEFVEEAVAKIPNLGLGSDVMVGFPGEGEEEFQETVSLIESLPFSYMHVFPFSRRKGTRVNQMDLPAVHSSVIKRRSKLLCERSRERRAHFYQTILGRTVKVLFESRDDQGLFCGLTPNYIRVGIASDQELSGLIRPVRIQEVSGGIARGTLVEERSDE
jgi:threonylcarbamoyladenosine tRNA methylthiotransferase MtaB